jgi:hypothetical protein
LLPDGLHLLGRVLRGALEERPPMSDPKRRGGGLRSRVDALLQSDDLDERLSGWSEFPPRQVINPLISFLCCSDDQLKKWRAVEAIGYVMSRMADENMESARILMRRLIWSLNDESGGIGWGSAEAMGEIMAVHERLADEYYRILVSYIREDGNRLENDLLERGVLWGIGRLAQSRPHLLQDTANHILPFLDSQDSVHRGLAAWTLSFLKFESARRKLEALLEDQAEVIVYEFGKLNRYRVGDLAGRALG